MDIYLLLALIFLGIPFVLGIIGVVINKIKTGSWWEGQGFGKK